MLEKSKIFYWAVVAGSSLFLLSLILLVNLRDEVSITQQNVVIMLQTFCILVTLIFIPLSLKLYDNIRKKEEDPHSETLQKWGQYRLTLLEGVLFLDGIIYFLTDNSSQLICAGIVWIVILFFCKPE